MSTDVELSEYTGSEVLTEENYNKPELIKVYTRLVKESFSLNNKNEMFLQVLISRSNLILFKKDSKILNIDVEEDQRKGSKQNYLHKRKKKNCDTKHDDNANVDDDEDNNVNEKVGDNVKVLMEYSSVCVLPKSLKLITNDLSETIFSYDLMDKDNLVNKNKITLKDEGFKLLMKLGLAENRKQYAFQIYSMKNFIKKVDKKIENLISKSVFKEGNFEINKFKIIRTDEYQVNHLVTLSRNKGLHGKLASARIAQLWGYDGSCFNPKHQKKRLIISTNQEIILREKIIGNQSIWSNNLNEIKIIDFNQLTEPLKIYQDGGNLTRAQTPLSNEAYNNYTNAEEYERVDLDNDGDKDAYIDPTRETAPLSNKINDDDDDNNASALLLLSFSSSSSSSNEINDNDNKNKAIDNEPKISSPKNPHIINLTSSSSSNSYIDADASSSSSSSKNKRKRDDYNIVDVCYTKPLLNSSSSSSHSNIDADASSSSVSSSENKRKRDDNNIVDVCYTKPLLNSIVNERSDIAKSLGKPCILFPEFQKKNSNDDESTIADDDNNDSYNSIDGNFDVDNDGDNDYKNNVDVEKDGYNDYKNNVEVDKVSVNDTDHCNNYHDRSVKKTTPRRNITPISGRRNMKSSLKRSRKLNTQSKLRLSVSSMNILDHGRQKQKKIYNDYLT